MLPISDGGPNSGISDYHGPRGKLRDLNEQILLALWEVAAPGDFIRCLRVCKRWNHLGQILLHKFVSLDNSSLASFIDCARIRPERLSTTKSLTVRLKICLPGFDGQIMARAGWRTKEQLLKKLADIMNQNMHALEIFSFQLEDEPLGHISLEGITAEPRISADSVISLLRSIPVSCTSLEIDTSGFEYYIGDDHLCPHIANLMSTLRHLRLRVGRICPDFINAPSYDACHGCLDIYRESTSPNIKSLIVNMELSDVIVGNSTRCSLGSPVDSSYRLSEDDPTERLQSEINQALRAGYCLKNCFPAATAIEVFGPVGMNVPPYQHIRHTDILKFQTHILTSTYLSAFIEGSWNPKGKRCLRTKDNTDLIGTKPKTREDLEGAWLTTTRGNRLPREAKAKQCPLRGHALPVRWVPTCHDKMKDYIRRNTAPFRPPLDPAQVELKYINIYDNIARTYPNIRQVPRSVFPEPYPMV